MARAIRLSRGLAEEGWIEESLVVTARARGELFIASVLRRQGRKTSGLFGESIGVEQSDALGITFSQCPAFQRLGFREHQCDQFAARFEGMGFVGRDNGCSVKSPGLPGAAETHDAAGQAKRDLNSMMLVETGFLRRMADPQAPTAPENNPSDPEPPPDSCSASAVGHCLTPLSFNETTPSNSVPANAFPKCSYLK